MRDDFTKSTKEKLAKRVGYHCSNCNKLTSGPGEASDGVSLIGVAAHICAASKGGPRYDGHMTSAERSSIDNGIWLCQNCARLIDTNTELFTVEKLHNIKAVAERNALKELNSNMSAQNVGIDIETRNQIIGCIRTMIECGKHLRSEGESYKPATIETDDTNIYNTCVAIYNACNNLIFLESQNHIQLKISGLDEKIFTISNMLPEFYDARIEWTGTNLIATNCNYVNFFIGDEGEKIIKKCKKLIKAIEELG